MNRKDAFDAMAALRADVRRLWPDGAEEAAEGFDYLF
jgi:hypothetical protein